MKRLIFDLDGTIACIDRDYASAIPKQGVVEKLREYKDKGFEIVISTSRNVRTHAANEGKINKETLPIILSWLEEHKIPFDEIYVGKPWCGYEGFYIDDKAVRPSEFENLSYEQIRDLLGKE